MNFKAIMGVSLGLFLHANIVSMFPEGVIKLPITTNKPSVKINPVRSYMFGATIMQNPNTKQVVTLFSDAHVNLSDCDAQALELAQQQQQEIVDLVGDPYFKVGGKKVKVIAEDSASFINEKDNYTQFNTPGVASGKRGNYYSPLVLLTQKLRACYGDEISVSNIEFRDYKDPLFMADVKQEVMDTVDSKTMEQVRNHYKGISANKDCPYVDARILQAIDKEPGSKTIVCAGGYHTKSVSKILYQQGYTNTLVKVAKNLPQASKKFVEDFKNNKPLVPYTNQNLPHLPALTKVVITTIKKFKE